MKKQTIIAIYTIAFIAVVVASGYLFFQKFSKFPVNHQYSREKEKIDIASFVKQQKALYLTIPDSNNEILTLVHSNTPGFDIPDMFLYGTALDKNNLTTEIPTARVLANDARYITNAGEVNGTNAALMPFYLDSGGSGTFLYIGLFSRIEKPPIPSETLRHESSIFIGDRVTLTGIGKNSDGTFTISYLDRKEGDPMAAEPDIPAIKRVMIVSKTSLEEVH